MDDGKTVAALPSYCLLYPGKVDVCITALRVIVLLVWESNITNPPKKDLSFSKALAVGINTYRCV